MMRNEPSTSRSTSADVVSLEITDAAGAVSRVELTGQRRIIGRSQQADVHLASTHVSRRHAEIFRDPFGRWWIRDLVSQNGTLVNGKTVTECVLGPSDTVGIGEFTLRLSVPARAPREHAMMSTAHLTFSTDVMGPISTIRDHEVPRIARHHLTKLMDLYHQLRDIPDLAERHRLLCQTLVAPEFQGQWAAVLRLDGTAPDASPELLCDPQVGRQGEFSGPISRGLLRAVLAKHEAVMAARTTEGAADIALSMTGFEQQIAAVACPLGEDGQRMDVLYIMLPAQYATGEWLGLAGLAADEFRHAEVARRAQAQAEAQAALERELASARHIQMSLIPKQVVCPGLELGVGFIPCRWVGGDYVDVVPMPDGRLLVAVADVCGKGLPAALLASRVHTGVHSNLAAGMNLPQLMTNLNNYLCKTIPETSFVTMVAMAIDVRSGHVEFVNAGHPPPLVVKPGPGMSRSFASGENPPLGLESGSLIVQNDELSPGQILSLYTDGLSELTCESGEMLGIEGLERELREICVDPAITARTAATALTRRLAHLLGHQLPQDDQTFLLVQRQS